MAKTQPTRPADLEPPCAVAIVASEYNREYVDGLLEHFASELEAIAPGSTLVTHRVPGAFEVPLAVQELARKGGVNAVVAFGVIIAGATAHADLIASAITQGLMQIALEHSTPIIHEVLLVQNEEQARERCLGERINRGAEAARAAVSMARAMRGIHG
jgi:6,7-dimethyl-8-ribityllumazine synthase